MKSIFSCICLCLRKRFKYISRIASVCFVENPSKIVSTLPLIPEKKISIYYVNYLCESYFEGKWHSKPLECLFSQIVLYLPWRDPLNFMIELFPPFFFSLHVMWTYSRNIKNFR